MSKEIESKNNISAFIVVYNEEKLIGRCLDSLSGKVDEIIVIHDGPCSDNTVEISKKYTDQVYKMPENKGIGESHYILAINKCKYNWILRIDADEYLSQELANSLHRLSSDHNIAAYAFIWPIWDGNKYISDGWPYKSFLFQKSKIGFIDIFHYPIIVYGKTVKVPLLLHHKPLYNNYTNDIFRSKTLRWCKIQARDYLVSIEEKEIYNVNIEMIRKEHLKKLKFYNFPVLCFCLSFFNVMIEAIKKPPLIFQKGFWFTSIISGRYSYNVAKEVRILIRNNQRRDRQNLQ